ncbi:hypothetical protein [Arenimonas sp.]|uniref:hypothetical protein n=1 Tax=Arenimonas sp. TaxID=1872635 RepID=UPI0025C20D06|nr:hypothetical protein [Arenimonas sp.]
MGKKFTAITVGLLLAAGAAQAAAPTAKTPRGQQVYEIVRKWAPHVQEVYGVEPMDWAGQMASTFAGADLAALSAAAQARTFDEMSERLLSRQPTTLEYNQAMAANPTPDALGDAATDLVFVPVTPCRIIDTRVAGGVIPANSTRDFDITDVTDYAFQGGAATNCNVGAAGSFAAAMINFIVVTPSTAGYITAYPFQASQPLAATVNYVAGDIRGNLSVVKLDQGAAASEMSVYTFAQTHLVADIVGYFINPAATNLDCVSTSVASFSIAANTVNFFNNPACPAGYRATTPYCWTAASGVYAQGSGYNANSPGSPTFCSWQNTTGSNQTTFGGNVCCRVPGR